ncbi:putative phage holin [Actinomadura litoris]|uniref:putative phage holin n=1 Tax=Actinomadura litoris TaxID=2678616 RepID=UPI001FA7723B|nr:hypothetical protein [Actinomadura litoris]
MIHLLGTIGMVAAAVGSAGFCVVYHLSARWWRSEEGWHLMSFTGALAAAFVWLTVRTFVVSPRPVSVGVEVGRTLVFCGIAGLLWWRLWILYRRQIRPVVRRGRRQPEERS